MKTLYIPTTTLNFNNILSSESLSPRAFYERRGYGYPYWYSLSDDEPEDAFLLCEKPFQFTRPVRDVEDHPMLIELHVEEQNLKPVREGLWLCDHTLYLSPWRTKFIFFSEQDKRTTLSMSECSLETKMTKLYHQRVVVSSYNPSSLPTVPLQPSSTINTTALEKEIRTNKLKGLLYGYYIGALCSVPPALVNEYNDLRELGDIIRSIASSTTKRPAPHQNERLDAIFAAMNKEAPFIKKLIEVGILDTESKISQLTQTAQVYDIAIPGMFWKASLINALANQNNPSFPWLVQKRETLDANMRKASKCIKPDDGELVICDDKVSTIKAAEGDEELVKSWINEVLCDEAYNGKVGAYNRSLADELTKKAKEFYGERWDDCRSRTRLNLMRKFLAGQETIETWDNGSISSITAVLLKGENWETLLAFMRSKGLNDYRLAFAFYGLLHGFANLTRDFTDILINYDDKKYVAEVIAEFNGQLLGDNLISVSTEPPVYTIEDNISNISSSPQKQEQILREVQKAGDLECDVQNFEALLYIADNVLGKRTNAYKALRNFCESHKQETEKYSPQEFEKKVFEICRPALDGLRDRRKREQMIEKIRKCIDLEARINDHEAFLYILDDLLVRNSKEYKAIKKLLRPVDKRENQEPDLFSNYDYERHPWDKPTKGRTLTDTSWIEETAQLIMGDKDRAQYKDDAKWFIDNHKDKNGCYYKKSTDDKSVIERYKWYMLRKRTNTKPEAAPYREIYQRIPIDEIIACLKKKYAL